MQLLSPLLLAVLAVACSLSNASPEKTCHVSAAPRGTDSAPAIVAALERCGRNAHSTERGRVVFGSETYTVKSVMNTTGLAHLDIDLHGTLEWDTNLSYWLNHSLPVGYQNQSSAWLFGGEDIRW
jgi:galacturan 1,4-alpha-galacturonidase